MVNRFFNYLAAMFALVMGLIAVPAAASSGGATIDYSGLTDQVSVQETITAVLAIGGTIILLTLAVMGVRKVISMVRGA